MPKKFLPVLLLPFLVFLTSRSAFAFCNIGGATSAQCNCSYGGAPAGEVTVSPCCAPGSDSGTRWESCGLDAGGNCQVRNNCANNSGGGGPTGGGCPGYCSGGNPTDAGGCMNQKVINCSIWNGDSWSCQNAPGGYPTCSWNENTRQCSGTSCAAGQLCSLAGFDSCNSSCWWVTTGSGQCGDTCYLPSGYCGQQYCHDSCTGAVIKGICPYISCPTPAPTPTPTPTPSPTPAPTPTPTPAPTPTPNTNGAWFQTKGGDVHANGMIGTTIPATCGMICSIGNFLSRLLSVFGS